MVNAEAEGVAGKPERCGYDMGCEGRGYKHVLDHSYRAPCGYCKAGERLTTGPDERPFKALYAELLTLRSQVGMAGVEPGLGRLLGAIELTRERVIALAGSAVAEEIDDEFLGLLDLATGFCSPAAP